MDGRSQIFYLQSHSSVFVRAICKSNLLQLGMFSALFEFQVSPYPHPMHVPYNCV